MPNQVFETRHYKWLAAWFKNYRHTVGDLTVDHAVFNIAAHLSATHSKFDREKFIASCQRDTV